MRHKEKIVRTHPAPKRVKNLAQHLEVPPSLTPLAEAIYANSMIIDIDRLIADLDNAQPTTEAEKQYTTAMHTLRYAVDNNTGVHKVTQLAVSSRSHALVDLGAAGAWRALVDYIIPRPGTYVVAVWADTRPFSMLAYRSGDVKFANIVNTTDVYQWISDKAGVPRTLGKTSLFAQFFGLAFGQVLDTANSVGLGLPEVDRTRDVILNEFPIVAKYIADAAEYDATPWRDIQRATNRVGNAGLARAHQLITEHNLGTPLALNGPSEVLYEVRADDYPALEELLRYLAVTGEGIAVQIDQAVLKEAASDD